MTFPVIISSRRYCGCSLYLSKKLNTECLVFSVLTGFYIIDRDGIVPAIFELKKVLGLLFTRRYSSERTMRYYVMCSIFWRVNNNIVVY